MNQKAYWIWYYGDYEIFHINAVNMRREERGILRPPFWTLATPYINVTFRKSFTCEQAGYIHIHVNGDGCVFLDGKVRPVHETLQLSGGAHTLSVSVVNPKGLPAVFAESDVCPSDGSWECNHVAGNFAPVGFHTCFDAPEKNPEVFPFAYENKQPVAVERQEQGILYDFGMELFGYLNIENADAVRALFVCYGESREEALDTDYSYITETVSGQNSYRLRQRAFRYIYIKNADATMLVSADYEYLPFENRGSFRCDNELFNQIFEASAHTLHLNCREGFLDGIKRDRWVWSADAYQSARMNSYLFADKEIEQRTLIGLIGKEPVVLHINRIIDWSLFWFIMLKEHYMMHGDVDFLKRIYPMALRLLAYCEQDLNEDGFIEEKPPEQRAGNGGVFIDHQCKLDREGAIGGAQMMLVAVYDSMAQVAEAIQEEAEGFRQKRDSLKNAVNRYYWKEDLGAFIDSYKSGNNHISRHTNIFAIMFDVATDAQKESIMKHVLLNEQVPAINTPYFKSYELDVLGKMGEFSAIEKALSSYWGGMLQLGATTIWEAYNPEKQGIEHYEMYGEKYHKSLCHAWGAGPVYLFGRYYLGVYPTSPGYQSFCVEPHPGGLKKIEGSVPVNGGTVFVSLDDTRLSVKTDIPGGTLIWNKEKYAITPDKELVIIL
ncbi:MAG: hypothetical protein IKL80_05820 [Clostridia bacterium]|nr:hypothetical protein [Clostridia bacterium]